MATILIIDDHPVNREILVRLLASHGHRLLEASDGAEALAVVRADRPQLVISDILMPTMDGYEFVRELRADPAIAEIPVVFYTANYHKHEAEHLARKCGVAHILIKPCKFELVLRVVENSLGTAFRSTAPQPQPQQDFDLEHVRVITDKLSHTADELSVVNQRLAALVEIGLQLGSQRDPRKLLEQVCRAARDLLGAKHAVLAIGSRDLGDDGWFVTSGMDPGAAGRLGRPAMREGRVGRAFTERKASRLVNPDGDPNAVGLPAGHPPVHSLLIAPIESIAHVYGWICLTDKLGAAEFCAEDEQMLTTLGGQVGRVYENGSIYVEMQNYATQLETEINERKHADEKVMRLNRVYAVLSGINTLIVRVRDRQELFDGACRIAVEQGNFGIAWIGRLDPDTLDVTPAAWAGAHTEVFTSEKSTADSTLARGRGGVGRAIRELKPIIDNDITTDPKRGGTRRNEAVRLGYRSLIVLPLIVQGAAVGSMSLFAKEPDFFTENEIKLLSELASNISFALEHVGTQEQLQYLAYYDNLTGLPNRTLFLDRMNQQLHECSSEPTMVALILFDLERFRIVNETMGRHGGDEVLRQVALRLEHACQGKENLARVSTNGYAVAMRVARDATDLAHGIESQILSCFRTPYIVNGSELRLAAKIGIALYPTDGSDADTLFRNAEAALKRAKTSGDRYLFYAADMNARAAQVLSFETRLRKAVEAQQFVLHYQPKFELASGRMCGLEALIRWQDPETGLVPPAQFIPLLEETGLIIEVGEWVIRQALSDYLDWAASGYDVPRIAVNVSSIQLRQRDFVEVVSRVIRDLKMTQHGLDLELTESILMQDIPGNILKLKALRDMGIDISIDDFGTGYSSLGYLARLPVNALKIDHSFILPMTSDADSTALVSAIISLGHSLNMKVIAEGVETEQQSQFLKLLKCNQVQGYLFSRPLPRAQIEPLLAKPETPKTAMLNPSTQTA